MRSEEEQKYKTILEDVRETSWRRQYLKDYLKLMRVSNVKKISKRTFQTEEYHM